MKFVYYDTVFYSLISGKLVLYRLYCCCYDTQQVDLPTHWDRKSTNNWLTAISRYVYLKIVTINLRIEVMHAYLILYTYVYGIIMLIIIVAATR